jgi:hypothetical protein
MYILPGELSSEQCFNSYLISVLFPVVLLEGTCNIQTQFLHDMESKVINVKHKIYKKWGE